LFFLKDSLNQSEIEYQRRGSVGHPVLSPSPVIPHIVIDWRHQSSEGLPRLWHEMWDCRHALLQWWASSVIGQGSLAKVTRQFQWVDASRSCRGVIQLGLTTLGRTGSAILLRCFYMLVLRHLHGVQTRVVFNRIRHAPLHFVTSVDLM
jgi:hypothetical protein